MILSAYTDSCVSANEALYAIASLPDARTKFADPWLVNTSKTCACALVANGLLLTWTGHVQITCRLHITYAVCDNSLPYHLFLFSRVPDGNVTFWQIHKTCLVRIQRRHPCPYIPLSMMTQTNFTACPGFSGMQIQVALPPRESALTGLSHREIAW